MSQQQELQRVLIKNGIIFAVVLVAIFAAMYGVSSMADSVKAQRDKAQSDITSVQQQIAEIKQKNSFLIEKKPIYDSLNLSDGKQTIARADVAGLFDTLRKRYALEDLRVDLGPVVEEGNPALKKPKAAAVSIGISAQMNSYSDESAVALLQDMKTSLKSILIINELSLEKASGTRAPLSMSFKARWLGVKQAPPGGKP